MRGGVTGMPGEADGVREAFSRLYDGKNLDATLKGDMPPLALPKQEFMERALTLWQELGLPPITPQPPWHGYSLGDWDDQYDVYAQRAVEGRWAESGNETIERRRAGLIPETPVRVVDTPKKKP